MGFFKVFGFYVFFFIYMEYIGCDLVIFEIVFYKGVDIFFVVSGKEYLYIEVIC